MKDLVTALQPDSGLSLNARGLLATHYALGTVMPADEAWKKYGGGRDKVRAAQNELIEAGYIVKKRWQDLSGNWRTDLILPTPEYQASAVETRTFTDACPSGVLSNQLAIKLLANSSSILTTNVVNIENQRFSETDDEEYVPMTWNLDEEAPAESKSVARRKAIMLADEDEDEDEAGAVGKLPDDKRAARQAKYGAKTQDTKPHRSEKPEESWSTGDLVAEFYALVGQHAPGIPSQVNAGQLSSWINRQVGQGVARIAVLRAIRRFFKDPRNIREVGVGKPLWRRFVAFFPTVVGAVVKEKAEIDQVTLDTASRSQDRFLRELGEL